jgi:regulator of RNase E activity RraA
LEGAIRNTDVIKRMGFPVYSRTIHPGYIWGVIKGISYNEPAIVGGAELSAGDIIVSDNDGVAAVLNARLPELLKAAGDILKGSGRF